MVFNPSLCRRADTGIPTKRSRDVAASTLLIHLSLRGVMEGSSELGSG